MTQEEKQLLMKDLCARLPYGVKYQTYIGDTFSLKDITLSRTTSQYYIDDNAFSLKQIKPYLRSMYTMTDKEVKEYLGMLNDIDKSGLMNHNFITKVVDWLDKKMFDHRGLIPMGIALEAPEGMYNIK